MRHVPTALNLPFAIGLADTVEDRVEAAYRRGRAHLESAVT